MSSVPLVLRERSLPQRGLQLVGLAVVVVVAIWAASLNPFRLGQLTNALTLATAIVGLNLATGYAGQLSIGHSAFFGLGAYTTGVLVVHEQMDPLLTLLPAAGICFVVGVIVGLPSLRIRGINLALVTLALGVAFPELVDRFKSLTAGSIGLNMDIRQLLPPHWTGFTIPERFQYYYWLSAGMLALALLASWTITRSRVGLALRAVRDNELAAAAMGVNLAWAKIMVFGVSAVITGLGGCVFAIYLGSLQADASFTLTLSITLITGLVIGGVATTWGPLLGGLAVVFIPYWTQHIRGGQASGLVFGLVLIALMFVMPGGVVGLARSTASRFVRFEPRLPVRLVPATTEPAVVPSQPDPVDQTSRPRARRVPSRPATTKEK